MRILLLFIISFSVFANEFDEYLGYEEAQSFVQTVGIKNKREYIELLTEGKEVGLPPIKDLPNVYLNYWQSWGEFLGEPDDSRSKRVKQPVVEELAPETEFGEVEEELREEGLAPEKGLASEEELALETEFDEVEEELREEGLAPEEELALETELQAEELFQKIETASEVKEGLTVEEEFFLDKETVITEETFERQSEENQETNPFQVTKQINSDGVPFLNYEELKSKVREYPIRHSTQYRKEYKNILGAPSNPDQFYETTRKWKGWSDFLGTKEKMLSYEKLQLEVKKRFILNSRDYQRQYKEILGASSRPDQFYETTGEWKGWVDFLGTEKKILSYKKLQLEVKKNSIRNFRGYRKQYRKILGAPAHPEQFYKKTGEWKGWVDFLGTQFLSYEELKSKLQEYGISSFQEYMERHKKILGAPSRPDQFYKKTGEWKGWTDFLGNEKKILSYKNLQLEVKKHPIFNARDYQREYQKILGAPARPDRFYKTTGEWQGWSALLGTNKCEKVFSKF